MRIPGADGVRAFVLGPPQRADLLADEDPQGAEAFPGHGLRARSSFFAAAEAADPRQREQHPAVRAALLAAARPALRRCGARRVLRAAVRRWRPTRRRPILPQESVAERARGGASTTTGSTPPRRWRSKLNTGINNTSLVLAFELPESKKVLLLRRRRAARQLDLVDRREVEGRRRDDHGARPAGAHRALQGRPPRQPQRHAAGTDRATTTPTSPGWATADTAASSPR